MRRAGKLLQDVQAFLQKNIREGITTISLDKIAEKYIRDQGAVPSFKNYQGYPATLCTMVNSEVVHAIPGDKILQNGDLLSVDCGLCLQGLHVDAAFSMIVGGDEQNKGRAQFSQCVKEALLAGCRAAKHGNHTGDIGRAIETVIHKGGYDICPEYTGHGIGYELHEDPWIFNYGTPGAGERLVEGMTICIEPIVARGNPQVKVLNNKWTVVTRDGRDACQWEHCGVVTKNGLEIFV